MADYGLKVSKSGYDIKNAGVENQIFNSEKNCLKLDVKSNSGTISNSSGSTQTYTVSHGFGFIPGFLVWTKAIGGSNWYSMYDDGYAVSYSDSTNLNIELVHGLTAYYVIIPDTAG